MEMTALSDTPTLAIVSEPGGGLIKIEQGVLYENSYGEGSKIKVEMKDVPKVIKDSNLQPASDHIFNGVNDDYNLFNITHSIFQPDFSIKAEPEMDIDDRHLDEEAEESKSINLQSSNDVLSNVPKLRLTPKSKLVASPNGTSDNKRRYVCTYENCTKSYGKSSHLRSHLTWHTGIKPFVCKEPGCGKGFIRSDELNRHIRTHTGEKPFECVQCTKKFSRSDHLTKHLATHYKQLSANNSLTKKMKTEKNVSPSSVKTFAITSPLGTSSNQNSQEMNLVDRCEPNTDYLKTTCEESLKVKQETPESNSDYLITMPNRKQNLNSNLSTSVQEILHNDEYNLFIKPEPIEEPQLNDLREESNEPDDDAIMPEANLPPIPQYPTVMPVVVKAEEPCLLKDSMNHMTDGVYDPTRPFPCHHCAKNFKRQDDLNRHMRTHTGEKPFACNECEKRFMRSDHLKKHLKTHTKTR